MLSFAMHCCIAGHFLLAFLFKTVSWQLSGSIVLEDLGSSVTFGTLSLIQMQIIFAILLAVLTLFAIKSDFFLEREIYLQFLIFTLFLVGIS